MFVFVVDAEKKPLALTHAARARQLLIRGKAAVYRHFPFTIILKRSIPFEEIDSTERRLKIDPGSKTTGIAIVNQKTGQIEFAAELNHRGQQIKSDLEKRRAVRRSRRNRKTRYRKPRFLNRTRISGWLPPSLMSRVHNIEACVRRLCAVCPIKAISLELVRFDMQKMENPEISGVEYQQGTLQGYEIREYLLEKWGRKCVYCGAENVRLEVEHIIPKAIRVDNRVSNLTISCKPCNLKKGKKTASEFGFPEIQAQAKNPLKDAASVNAIRWKVFETLKATELSIECGTGGRTKYNRTQQKLPKTHWIDAACVGESTPERLSIEDLSPLIITACGWGSRQMCLVNRFGFPRTRPKTQKKVYGFQTGDIVKAIVTKGKKVGTYIGRVAVRTSGSFNITTQRGIVQGIGHRYCKILHCTDGYSYN